jgi:carboxynorspermidine decarboxylase
VLNWNSLKPQLTQSPALVLNHDQVLANVRPLQTLRAATDCHVVYSIKALPLVSLLQLLLGKVDGFSVSSLFEARLAREVLGDAGSVHLTTPGMRADEFAELGQLCSHISFNSLTQCQRLQSLASGYSAGVRVNPQQSFVADARYDPCRRFSKLGVAIDDLARDWPAGIEGLHWHTVFGRGDFLPMQHAVERVSPLIAQHPELQWINLGGGYLYNQITDQRPVRTLIDRLQQRFGVQVIVEPGKAVVTGAGFLVTTVVDRFDSDGKTVLVLDTSVNHLPEVFEYQTQPPLLEAVAEGSERALLVGSTCLAGDLFGEYRFKQLPAVGDKLVFEDAAAYSVIKAHRFNGYNLPAVYSWQAGELLLRQCDDYAWYRRQWWDC